MAECRSCFAPIIWAVSATTGSRMPIDEQPVDGGNVLLTWGRRGEPPQATVLGREAAQASSPPLYRPHYASCPNAAQHRKTHATGSHRDARR